MKVLNVKSNNSNSPTIAKKLPPLKNRVVAIAENNYLRFIIWAGLLLLTTVGSFTLHLYRRRSGISDLREGCLLLVALMIYLLLMFPLHSFLREKIYALIVPKVDEKEGGRDVEMARICAVLSFGLIVLLSLIWTLLAGDYFGHAGTLAPEVASSSSTSVKPTAEDTISFLGTYGDFFGGVLNPILTFGTLIGLAITILMQRLQLRDARKEALTNGNLVRKQAFETTFFNMLNLHAENVRNLRFDPRLFYKSINPSQVKTDVIEGRAVFAEVLDYTMQGAQFAADQLAAYRKLHSEHHYILGHYYRHLYQILELIESAEVGTDKTENDAIQKSYTNILRAQISSPELVVLLLNCTNNTPDDEALRRLLIKYEFLENLPAYTGTNGMPIVWGLAPNRSYIFKEYLPRTVSAKLARPTGAFGKNEVFAKYLKAQLAIKRPAGPATRSQP
ncbi:hypothetical protein GTP45_14645 [Pseudoduganella sp. FT55W]|uniref:Uncharacterized protein n=1 Tax=Duganella rivi TaxID=2666083 RepID=A0A7X4GRW4_9BURK|nr:putative phage abortive infection protein [Duganella rivi]MYM68060.1 hypothetical protein [Duganella rivi]